MLEHVTHQIINLFVNSVHSFEVKSLVVLCYIAECHTITTRIVLRKSQSGFGMTMCGSDPVFIQNLQEGNVVSLLECILCPSIKFYSWSMLK